MFAKYRLNSMTAAIAVAASVGGLSSAWANGPLSADAYGAQDREEISASTSSVPAAQSAKAAAESPVAIDSDSYGAPERAEIVKATNTGSTQEDVASSPPLGSGKRGSSESR